MFSRLAVSILNATPERKPQTMSRAPYLRQGDAVIYLSDTSIPVAVEALQRLAQGKEVVPVIYLPRRASDLVRQVEPEFPGDAA